MKNDLEKKGQFEIFKTTEGNELLKLGAQSIYAIVETNKGHILVATDEKHEKEETIQKGSFYLIDFDNDPSFRDNPHLFLKEGSKFKELILPRGLPDDSDIRKKVIFTDEYVSEQKVKTHLKNDRKKVLQKENLQDLEKKELDRIARKKDIKGRSKLNKQALARKIKKTESK